MHKTTQEKLHQQPIFDANWLLLYSNSFVYSGDHLIGCEVNIMSQECSILSLDTCVNCGLAMLTVEQMWPYD